MSMPDDVEMPEAKDFCRGEYRNSRGQCCFEGWKRTLFPDLTIGESSRFRAIARDQAKKMQLDGEGDFIGVTSTNDNQKNTKEQLATWFERTVQIFGYDIS